MSGAELGRVLRESEQTRHVKILMNSSLPEQSVTPHFPGYDAFLRKPYGIDRALEVIGRLLDGG